VAPVLTYIILIKNDLYVCTGNLALIQRGYITEGECAGGFFEKFVINAVDQSGCSGTGITKQIPIYALAQITNGTCAAVCPGTAAAVWFDPPVKNTLD